MATNEPNPLIFQTKIDLHSHQYSHLFRYFNPNPAKPENQKLRPNHSTMETSKYAEESDTFCKYTDVFYYPEIPEGLVSSWFEARLIIRSSFSTKRHLYWVLTRDICLNHTSRNNENSV
ncbi:uncharacterized protein LOC107002360 [Solanum pennellii]|uniref:Uncharacterized protein LOC107002360 n=1 Tax=Solanum pennellii TaxID=28526 RepID=A0ABM1FEN7_SOLPN|nr:uncharacterized protein LOC107002360 [Solanum pennellii]